MMREGDWQMHRLFDEKSIRIAMDHLREFHKERYKDRPGEDLIQTPHVFDFYVKLALENAANGYVRLYQFTYNDEIVAVQYAIEHNGRYLMLMMGLDFERVGRYSPGLLMTEDLIEECIKEGMKIFDFTVGDEPLQAQVRHAQSAHLHALAYPFHAWQCRPYSGRSREQDGHV